MHQGMDEIISGLFIGTEDDATNQPLLRKHDISTIVSLTYNELDREITADMTVSQVPMMDGPQNDFQAFLEAVHEVREYRKEGARVLVHCSAGASRSPAVVATSLTLSTYMTLETAFQRVSEQRPAVDPHEALVRQAARVVDSADSNDLNCADDTR